MEERTRTQAIGMRHPSSTSAALALLTAPLLLACPSADGAQPGNLGGGNARSLTLDLTVATDTTVDISAFWSGSADEWRWRVPSDSGAVSVGQVTVADLPRADTAESRQFCVRGVNFTGAGDERVGPEACATFRVPAVVVSAPSAPTIDSVSVDSTTTLSGLIIYPDSLAMMVDTQTADTITLAFHRGQRVDSVDGWQYQQRAELWEDGVLLGCGGDSIRDPSAYGASHPCASAGLW